MMGETDKSTGYELTELARAYYIFEANGFTVDVASTEGGNPPVVIDTDDMREFDYAFLNDSVAQNKVKNTIAVKDIDPSDYEAVYFVGGKGAMWDFPENESIKKIIRTLYEENKVIGAVCHGPAALVNVTLSDGSNLLEGKKVSSFTNEEELLLISDAREIFPFLLQDKLKENGAEFVEGAMYLNQVSVDENIITGQNPWSTWTVAENVVSRLGYTPKAREISSEENAVQVLGTYESNGYSEARTMIKKYCEQNEMSVDRELLAVHGLVAVYQLKLIKFVQLVRLLSYSNRFLDS